MRARRFPIVLTTAAACLGAFAAAALVIGPAAGQGTASPPVNSSPPSISGTARQGQVLTGTSGSWTGLTPISYAYQWQRCNSSGANCANLSGATSQTYTLVGGDVGSTLRVQVTAMNADGTAVALSNASGVVASQGSAPAATSQPTPTGTAQDGSTLTVSNGTWSGTTPITYTYQWQRCTASNPVCSDITGATSHTYKAATADVSFTLRAIVTAMNSAGSGRVASNLTAVVAGKPSGPVNTALPAIGGTAQVGQTLSTSTGSWNGTAPITFTYQWQRCNAGGTSCSSISGATSQTYLLGSADLASTIRSAVTAKNSVGTGSATSGQTATVAAAGPPGVIDLGGGVKSVSANVLSLPDRLVIDKVEFTPTVLRSHDPFTARFHVSATGGYVVRDALVYVVGIPYDRLASAPEQATGQDGWVTFQLRPGAALPLKNGTSLVMFLRVRKQGDDLLAGISNRRLVQVRVGRAG